MASPVGDPHSIPVSHCVVRIFNDKGNEFLLQEYSGGIYKGKIDQSHTTAGSSFKVEIRTPDGTFIESDFDMINECPEVDSVYFESKELEPNRPGEVNKGLQFYVDMDGGDLKSHFFRWEGIETWEYHADYPMEWYYDGSVHHIVPPDYSGSVCWNTKLVKNIYTLSTENLVENKYKMLPINFVDNHGPHLIYGYSLLVNQYALSEAAYSYWDQLRINGTEQGGLYEKQPLAVTGNLHNVTFPDQEVLGFFSASSVKSKRIFVRDVNYLEIDFSGFCNPMAMEHGGFLEINPADYPAFLMGDELGFWMVSLSNECVDCRTVGGTNVKPDFWPY
jgi:hypothetical protein